MVAGYRIHSVASSCLLFPTLLPKVGVHADGVKKAWPWQTALDRIDSTLAWLET